MQIQRDELQDRLNRIMIGFFFLIPLAWEEGDPYSLIGTFLGEGDLSS